LVILSIQVWLELEQHQGASKKGKNRGSRESARFRKHRNYEGKKLYVDGAAKIDIDFSNESSTIKSPTWH